MTSPAYRPGQVAAAVEPSLIVTPMADRLVDHVLQEWLTLFLTKNYKYRLVRHELGPKGVFPDIWRKVGVLKARVWEGDLAGSEEPTVEIIDDIIGHLFLMRDMIIQESLPPLEFAPNRLTELD